MRRSNGRGTEGKNDTVLVRDIGAKRKKRGVFSYGEVFFLLTCPLMGDPFIKHISCQPDNKLKLQNIFLSVEKKRFDSVQKVHEQFTRSELTIRLGLNQYPE
jgi:hypothetical protein